MLNQKEYTANHIMVDLETLGTDADAMIISIGAVIFNFDGHPTPTDKFFYTTIDLDKSSGSISGSTVKWWLDQPKDAQKPFTQDNLPTLESALIDLHDWIVRLEDKEVRVWGNGANFDNVILRNALLRHRLPVPWKYVNDRCFRTMKAMLPSVDITKEGIRHNALHDALYQMRYLLEAVKGSSAHVQPAKINRFS